MRQALEYAIDKEGIAKSVGLGFMPARRTAIIHSVADVVDPGTTPRKYDPEKAKALMAEAGHPTVECTLSYDTNEDRPEPARPPSRRTSPPSASPLKLNGMTTGCVSRRSAPRCRKATIIIFNGLRGGPRTSCRGRSRCTARGPSTSPASHPPAGVLHADGPGADIREPHRHASRIVAKMEKIAYDDAQVIPITMADFISVSGPKLKNMNWTLANTPTPWFNEAWLVK